MKRRPEVGYKRDNAATDGPRTTQSANTGTRCLPAATVGVSGGAGRDKAGLEGGVEEVPSYATASTSRWTLQVLLLDATTFPLTLAAREARAQFLCGVDLG